MEKEKLKQLLEDSLNSIPGVSGNTQVTGSGTLNMHPYVACNRRGNHGRPKLVYRLDDLGDKFQLSLVINATRFEVMAQAYKENHVGGRPHLEGVNNRDACISSGSIYKIDIKDAVLKFYRAYDAAMM